MYHKIIGVYMYLMDKCIIPYCVLNTGLINFALQLGDLKLVLICTYLGAQYSFSQKIELAVINHTNGIVGGSVYNHCDGVVVSKH